MRYSLRTLLILLAIGPPLVAGVWLYTEAFAVIAIMVAIIVAVPFAIAFAALLIGLPAALAIEFVESLLRRNNNRQ